MSSTITDVHDAPLLGSVVRFVEQHSLEALPGFLLGVGRNMILPIAIVVCTFGGLVSTLRWIGRFIVPPPARDRYRQAKKWYRRGQQKEALKEWESLKKFGPAYLSRATHALYVQFDPQQALGILRTAKEEKVKIQLKQVEMIKLDAKAVQAGGNATMLDMNARLAKQEHLGVTTL